MPILLRHIIGLFHRRDFLISLKFIGDYPGASLYFRSRRVYRQCFSFHIYGITSEIARRILCRSELIYYLPFRSELRWRARRL